jgi:hypothetical protein
VLLAVMLSCAPAFATDCSNRPPIPLDPLQPVSASNQMTTNPSGGPPGSPYYEPSPPNPKFQMLHVLVGCMEDTIYSLGLTSFSNFRIAMRNTVTAVLTLFIAIFFTKAMFKGFKQNEGAEFAVMGMKFAGVSFFVLLGGVEQLMPSFLFALQWFTNIVTAAAPGPAACNYTRLWMRLDCGITGILSPSSWMISGVDTPWVLFAIAGQALFTPAGPVLILLVGIMVILLLAAFATATLAYIMCLIALMILMMISPIIIPLILFTFTRGIFDIWFRLLFGYMLQPMLLFAYLAFMLNVISMIIYGPPSSSGNTVLGLAPIMTDIYTTVTNPGYRSHRPVVSGETRIESGTGPLPANPAARRNTEVDGWSFVVADFNFGPSAPPGNPCQTTPPLSSSNYVSCRYQHLNINLIALVVTLALTFSFMNTVMTRASELVGAGASASFMSSINVYGQTVQFMQAIAKDVTQAVVTGGSDLSFKNTVSQTASVARGQAGL